MFQGQVKEFTGGGGGGGGGGGRNRAGGRSGARFLGSGGDVLQNAPGILEDAPHEARIPTGIDESAGGRSAAGLAAFPDSRTGSTLPTGFAETPGLEPMSERTDATTSSGGFFGGAALLGGMPLDKPLLSTKKIVDACRWNGWQSLGRLKLRFLVV